jgi:hypothetical protein
MRKLLLFFLTTFALMSCDKDDDAPQTLPEATQTGRGIFACYVNGKPYIDIRQPNTINFNAYYQLVNGEYFFNVTSSKEVSGLEFIQTIKIATYEREVNSGETYQLLTGIEGNAWAGCAVKLNSITSEFSETNSEYSGEMTITKLDIENQIVSGTFWFDVENPFTGETIEIREGRFDTNFGL